MHNSICGAAKCIKHLLNDVPLNWRCTVGKKRLASGRYRINNKLPLHLKDVKTPIFFLISYEFFSDLSEPTQELSLGLG